MQHLKTYALESCFEGFISIKAYMNESRTGTRQKGETRKQGSSHCLLALNSPWRAGGVQPPPSGLLARNGELFTRRGELMQLSPA
jgi:hypothetical protein